MSVITERSGRVATVILDRPERRNAVDRPTAEALAAAVRAVENDSGIDVGILWGAGGNFCAGADLRSFAEGSANRLEPDGDGPMGPTRLLTAKPWIAAISGYAVAGGLELALWCDLRVCESDSVFGVFCRRWGVPLIDGGTVRLPRIIGAGRALDLILTGRAVAAEEALAIGLVNRVVAQGEARIAAEELGMMIAAHPQACLRADRRSVYEQQGLAIEDALRFEFGSANARVLHEAAEGAQAFAAGVGRHGLSRGQSLRADDK